VSVHDDACAELLRDWVSAQAKLIGEFSGNTTAEYRRLLARGQAWAVRLGIAWSDDCVPDYVRETLSYAEPEGGEW
jgi:hypothetical protein